MIWKLSELEEVAKKSPKKTLVVAAAHDEHSLEAVCNAFHKGLVDAILVGNEEKIRKFAAQLNLDINGLTIIHEPGNEKAVEIAVKKIKSGEAQILMKGNIGTALLLKGVLNKEWGLRKGDLLSHFALFEIKAYHKLIALTDAAMNIAPDLKSKVSIINNSVEFMNRLGFEKPKIAVLAAVEVVNDAMPATLDAALLSKMSQRGQIKNCIIDGPLAFDNAISRESAEHKGIISDVAGDADLLLVPDIEAGNVLYKSFVFFAAGKAASLILGASAPIILTSRSDSEESKLFSIAMAASIN